MFHNKKTLAFLIAALLAAPLFAGDKEDIRKVFSDYKQAILGDDADTALDLVSLNTIRYYDKMLDASLYATPDECRKHSVVDKIVILRTRQGVPVKELKAMDGKGFFKYAVQNGWVGKDSVIKTEISGVTVSGKFATTDLRVGDRQSPSGYRFVKEDGRWKIDLTSIMPTANSAMQTLIRQMKIGEEAFLFRIIETVSGKRVNSKIWEAPLKRK